MGASKRIGCAVILASATLGSPTAGWSNEPEARWTDRNLTPACVDAMRTQVERSLGEDSALYSDTKRLSVETMAVGIHLERPVSYFYYAAPEYAVSASIAASRGGPHAALGNAIGKASKDFSLGMLRDFQDQPAKFARGTAAAAYQLGRSAYVQNQEHFARQRWQQTTLSDAEVVQFFWNQNILQYMFLSLELNQATNQLEHAGSSVMPTSLPVQSQGTQTLSLHWNDELVGDVQLHQARPLSAQESAAQGHLVMEALLELDESAASNAIGTVAYLLELEEIFDHQWVAPEDYAPVRRYRARERHLRAVLQRDLRALCGAPPPPQPLPKPVKPLPRTDPEPLSEDAACRANFAVVMDCMESYCEAFPNSPRCACQRQGRLLANDCSCGPPISIRGYYCPELNRVFASGNGCVIVQSRWADIDAKCRGR